VAIDDDRRRVEYLREDGLDAIYGDATTPGVLEAAGVAGAKLLILATPESYQIQEILEAGRRANPGIDTAVRAHSDEEVALLARQGVGVAIMGKRELTLGLLEYALSRFGMASDEAHRVVTKARLAGEGGVFDRQFEAGPGRLAPERRPHRQYDL